jgi:hypothetical protein
MNTETALEVVETRPESVALGTLNASTPAALVAGATAMAKSLADVIDQQRLYSTISGRKFVKVEGWTTLATMAGFLPRERSVVRLEDGGYEATVDLIRLSDGAVLTSASAECGSDEPTWANRPRYARRSMAITRATSKACRIAFSWVMALAGYEVTPAEEMDGVEVEPRRAEPTRKPPAVKPAPRAARAEPAVEAEALISPKQGQLFWFRCGERADQFKEAGVSRETIAREVLAVLGVEHTKDIPARSFDRALELVMSWEPGKASPDAECPF